MGIIDKLVSRLGYTKATEQYSKWLLETAGHEQWMMPDYSLADNQTDLYRRLSWVNIAVTAVANTVSTTKLSVKSLTGEKTTDEVNHPFEQLLMRPNPLQSRSELMAGTASYIELTGSAYWWLNRTRDNEQPSEIYLMPSHRIKPVPDDNLFLKGYVYDPGSGRELALETWEVVHFRAFNPKSMYLGLSKIESISTVAVGDMKMSKWNTELFAENNARLPGILAFKDSFTASDWELMQKQVKNAAAKRQYMLLQDVGAGGVEWIQAGISQRDMEFLSGRQANKEEIFNVFAPGLVGMLDKNATEANSETAKATFIDHAVWPLCVAIGEKITNDIMPAYGPNLLAEFDDIRMSDREMLLAEQVEFSKTHTLNEIREKYYQADPLPDERGDLLPAQITGFTVKPEPEEVETTMQPVELPEPVTEPEPEVDDQDEIEEELKAWEKFAINRLGKKARAFKYEHVPIEQAERIQQQLYMMETAEEIKTLFEIEKGDKDNEPMLKVNREFAIMELAAAIKEAVVVMSVPETIKVDNEQQPE